MGAGIEPGFKNVLGALVITLRLADVRPGLVEEGVALTDRLGTQELEQVLNAFVTVVRDWPARWSDSGRYLETAGDTTAQVIHRRRYFFDSR